MVLFLMLGAKLIGDGLSGLATRWARVRSTPA